MDVCPDLISRVTDAVVDEYTACGGDFYARGHIRAIAEVVRIDSAPLIREYDRVHRAPGMVSRVSLDELLATSAQAPHRRQPSRPAAEPESAVAARASASRRRNWAGVLGLAVAVALGFVVYRVLTVPPHAAVIPPTGQAAADHPARHARPDQAPYPGHGSWAPSLAPAVPAQKPSPFHAAASSAGNLAHRPADRRSARGPLAPRLTSQRRLQEPAYGHAPASGHEPPGHGRGRLDHLRPRPQRQLADLRRPQTRPGTHAGGHPRFRHGQDGPLTHHHGTRPGRTHAGHPRSGRSGRHRPGAHKKR